VVQALRCGSEVRTEVEVTTRVSEHCCRAGKQALISSMRLSSDTEKSGMPINVSLKKEGKSLAEGGRKPWLTRALSEK